ncbi:hypothetical protein [Desulfatitalea tepidiphila]|uniref:hypothetical protein n=1 Tax=Desulfatitalea tepidiphila TaxID=1185843 RepID=UPI00128F0272|nr:hypothetical protein [Desulfatitalea tepidiphila]
MIEVDKRSDIEKTPRFQITICGLQTRFSLFQIFWLKTKSDSASTSTRRLELFIGGLLNAQRKHITRKNMHRPGST